MAFDGIFGKHAPNLSVDLVEIPGGQIELRDDRKKETWTVEIESFLLGRYPVTQDLYFDVTQESPSTFIGARRPVENVSWVDAVKFCNSLSVQWGYEPCYYITTAIAEITFNSKADGFRLPTEAEWEYSCKAGKSGTRYGELDSISWYKGNSDKMTHAVGMKTPNSWGLYDMLGNVWEWCSDIYDETVYGSYRIFRGGGWYDEARGCMATNRRRSHPTSFKIDDLGFRIARNKTSRN
jgi:formylglycine-generating enzyme required for sulfatase activity